jgi:hypothetical protein
MLVWLWNEECVILFFETGRAFDSRDIPLRFIMNSFIYPRHKHDNKTSQNDQRLVEIRLHHVILQATLWLCAFNRSQGACWEALNFGFLFTFIYLYDENNIFPSRHLSHDIRHHWTVRTFHPPTRDLSTAEAVDGFLVFVCFVFSCCGFVVCWVRKKWRSCFT